MTGRGLALFDHAFEQRHPGAAPRVAGLTHAAQRVPFMVTFLERAGGPVHARTFERRFDWSDRLCRAVAEASEGRVLSTNSGYLLTERATPEQFKQANGRIDAQGRKMLRRAIRERRVWHAAGHGPSE